MQRHILPHADYHISHVFLICYLWEVKAKSFALFFSIDPKYSKFCKGKKTFLAQEYWNISNHKASYKTLVYFKGLKNSLGTKKSCYRHTFWKYLFVGVILLHASATCILTTEVVDKRDVRILLPQTLFFNYFQKYTFWGKSLTALNRNVSIGSQF